MEQPRVPAIGAPRDEGPPGVPPRRIVLLAFFGVVLAGLLGGLAAYGIVDTATHGDEESAAALAAVVGAAVSAVGAGIVAVLVLRARALWHVARDEEDDAARTANPS